jgi:hypothetical protein
MRILLLTVDYPDVLEAIYRGESGESDARSFRELYALHCDMLFSPGMGDAFNALGCDATEVHANNLPLQRAWIREHGLRGGIGWAQSLAFKGRRTASLSRALLQQDVRSWRSVAKRNPLFDTRNPEMMSAIDCQIKALRPDVVYNFDPALIDGRALWQLKPYFGALVAQIASPISQVIDW